MVSSMQDLVLKDVSLTQDVLYPHPLDSEKLLGDAISAMRLKVSIK